MTPWMALPGIGETMHSRAIVRELSLPNGTLTLHTRQQSERKHIDRPPYWSPAATHSFIAALLNKPCCRCPAFVAAANAEHHEYVPTARLRPTKRCPMAHTPKLDRRRLHMQHTGGLSRELIFIRIEEFCGQWTTDTFVTPWASTEPRARIPIPRDGSSGQPFGQSAWP